MAPVELPCPAGGECTYKTPKLEATDALKLLEMHERTAHSGTSSQSSVSGRKPEKFPRPTISIDESTERWDDFKSAWEQYKLEYNLEGTRLTRQLYACCSTELATGLSRLTSGKHFSLNETDMLEKMKELSVQFQNPAVYVQNFLNVSQEQDENVRHYLSRLKGIAAHCNFQTKCSCGLSVSYAESITLFKLVAGLIDEEIKEDILGCSDKTLEETVKAIEAKESAKRAKSSLVHVSSSAGQVSKVSDDVKGDRHKPCSHCGRRNHSGAFEDRKQNCPA